MQEQKLQTLDDVLNVLMTMKKKHGGATKIALASDEEGNSFSKLGVVELCDMSEDAMSENPEMLYLIMWPSGELI